MNIADTIRNARDQGAHRPFKNAKLVKDPVFRTNPDTLEICDDPLPSHRASAGNKYEPTLKKLKLGQAIKCLPAEVGRVAGAMRKYIENNKIQANVRTIKDYGDGFGRVWMLAAEKKLKAA